MKQKIKSICRQEFENVCGDEEFFSARPEAVEQNRMDWALWRQAWNAAINRCINKASSIETDPRKWVTEGLTTLIDRNK